MSRLTVLTGGTSGLGLQVLKDVLSADPGARALVLCRNQARAFQMLNSLAQPLKPRVDTVLCDVGDMDSVRQAAERIAKQAPAIDTLVLNAGIVRGSRSADTLAVNHLGQFLLAALLQPQLLKGTQPRLLLVSSELHKGVTHPADPAQLLRRCRESPPPSAMELYRITKLFNVWTAAALARRAGSRLWVGSVTPGFVPTTGLHRGSGMLASLFMRWVMAWAPFAVSLSEGARRISQLVLAEDPVSLGPSGSYFSKGQCTPASAAGQDAAAAEQLFSLSMREVGVDDFFGPP
ncbi:hypothetical protein V8C86DRAFT_2520459 [Haematococcus lacustris]